MSACPCHYQAVLWWGRNTQWGKEGQATLNTTCYKLSYSGKEGIWSKSNQIQMNCWLEIIWSKPEYGCWQQTHRKITFQHNECWFQTDKSGVIRIFNPFLVRHLKNHIQNVYVLNWHIGRPSKNSGEMILLLIYKYSLLSQLFWRTKVCQSLLVVPLNTL